MTQAEFLIQIASWLEAAGIPFMVAGSHVSSLYSQPRATNDVDLVIDPTPEQLARFLTSASQQFYVSPEAARDALQRRSMFNIIDFTTGWKADLIVRKERAFSVEELGRRRMETLAGSSLPVASPEDIILTKLEWDKITPSERQVQDALHVAAVQWDRLDREYLRRWAPQLGVEEKLDQVLAEAQSVFRKSE